MSLFKNNFNATPPEDRLREWGDAERAAPPTRRGRFAGIVDRMTRGASPSAPHKPALSPFLVWSGASALTAAAAFGLYSAQDVSPAQAGEPNAAFRSEELV